MADRSTPATVARLAGPALAALVGVALALRPAWPSRPGVAPDLGVYWATARAWSPRAALPDPDLVRQAAGGVELGGGFVYPAWTLLPFELLARLSFAEAVRVWRGVLVLSIGAAVVGWLVAGQERRWATAGGLAVAAALFHRGVGTGLLQGNAELVVAGAIGLAAALLRTWPAAAGVALGIAGSIKLWPLVLVGMARRRDLRLTAAGAAATAGALLLLDPVLTSTPWGGVLAAWRQLPEDGQRSLAAWVAGHTPLGGLAAPSVAAACLLPLAWLARREGATGHAGWPAAVALGALLAVPRTLPYAWTLALGPCAVAWATLPAARLGLVAWAVTTGQPVDLQSMATVAGTLVGAIWALGRPRGRDGGARSAP
ncbi:MAG: DUF2029 domain-containing protein [Alphaproteobacteria bacterium]|nr:DUF2029 domain-containing protein [Alphaproteobacteria bacterium]